jgi:hypothetical protein
MLPQGELRHEKKETHPNTLAGVGGHKENQAKTKD